ncbi:MaoC family dehydratase [Curvibacter sp. APW13]|uniref:MaoC family dehydratase n=1 Tax=Curvibacter sp. APW13 TaxID=3077236 RepID=UPI0028E0538C|nr:MaoC family dehydratase [Curvibacter sp. APW13]MDT8991130.1 MaoC family dehydratase [Curvibacter sp. APW13]
MGTHSHPLESITLQYDAPPRLWAALGRALLRKAPAPGAPLVVPAITAQWRGARAHAPSLRSYTELCEDNNAAAGVCVPPAPAPYYTFVLPPLFIHAMAMPLHLAILTHPRFTLPLMGLVHLANRTEMLCPVPPTEALDFTCTLEGVEPGPKGPQFTLHTSASVNGKVVWREQSTYVYPQQTGATARRRKSAAAFEPDQEVAQWDVAADAGRRFALPVRDFNPIHLSSFSARLLGQRTAIAHGLFSAARCLDVLRQQQPVSTPYVLDVQFKRPLPLPSRVALYAQAYRQGRKFSLQILDPQRGTASQPHLEGTLLPLSDTH